MPHSPKLPGHVLAWFSLSFAGQLAAQAPYPCTWEGGNGGDWVSPQWAPQPLDFIKESGIPIPLITWPDNNRAVSSGNFVYVPTIGSGRVNLNSIITVSAVGVSSGAEIRIRGGTLRLEGYSGYSGAAAANDGLISLGDNATLTAASAVFLPSGLTIGGGGTVSLLDEASAIKGNLIDFGSSQLIRGAGQIGVAFGTVGETPSSVVNRGTVLADAPPLAMTIQGTDYENKGTTRALGGGLLKFRSLATDNQQLIEAQTGVADFQDYAVENSGTLRAAAGGILQFKNQTIANAGGLIEATGMGSLVQLRGDVTLESGILRRTNRTTVTLQTGTNTFTGGLLVQGRIEIEPTAGLRLRNLVLTGEAGTVLNPQPGAVIFSDAPVDLRGRFDGNGLWSFNAPLSLTGPLTLNALQFDVGAGQPVNVSGTVTNNSVVRLLDAAGAPDTRILAADGSVVTGAGQVRFATNQTNRLDPAAPGAVFTNAAPHLLTTEVGGNAVITAGLVNTGTTEVAGAASTMLIHNPFLTNAGLLQAREGGFLRVNNAFGGTGNFVFTNTGGTLRLGAGSSAQFESNVLFRGGTIDGPGSLNLTGTTIFDSLPDNPITITDASVVVNEFQPFFLRGNLTNSGTFVFNDGAAIAPGGQQGSAALTLDGDVSIGGTGRLLFATERSNFINAVGASTPTLTIGAAQTITNTPGSQGFVYPNTVNAGLIEAIGPPPTNTYNIHLFMPSLTNTGVIAARANGLLFFNSTNMSVQNAGGVLRATDGGLITYSGNSVGPTIFGGTLESATGGYHLFNLGTLDGVATPVQLNGLVDAKTFFLRGNLNTSATGTLQLANGNVFVRAEGASFTGAGRILFVGLTQGNNLSASPGSPAFTLGAGTVVTTADGARGVITNLVFSNAGTIEARGPASILDVNPTALANAGLVQAINGGSLSLGLSQVANAGGTLRVDSASAFVFNSNVAIQGGTLDGTGTFTSNLLTFDGTAQPLTQAATVSLPPFGGLTLRGTIQNPGLITMNGTAAGSLISISGPVTLGGTGRVLFNSNGNNSIIDAVGTGALLTLAAGQSITTVPGGRGSFVASLLNQGVVEARGTGAILNFVPNAFTNAGVVQAVEGGTMDFNLTSVANAAGILRVESGSAFPLGNNVQIRGGRLEGSGAFTVNFATLDGSTSTVTNAGTLSVASGGTLFLRRSITNDGLISAGTSGAVRIHTDGATLGGSGIFRFSSASNPLLTGPGTNVFAPLTLLPGALITTNPGTAAFLNGIDLTNQSTIEARGSGTQLRFGPRTVINQGILQSADSGTFTLEATAVENAGGILRVASGSSFGLTGSVVIRGGTLEGSGVFGVGLATLDGVASAVTVTNTLSLAAGSVLTARGTLTNHGVISLAPVSTATLSVPAQGLTLGGTGVVRFTAGTGYFRGNGAVYPLTIAAGATVTSAPGGRGYVDSVALTNLGTIEARGAGAIVDINANATNQAVFAAAEGATLNISGANNLVIENAAGIVRAEAGSAVLLIGGIEIRSGRFEGAGAVQSQGARLVGSTQAVVNAGNLQVGSSGLTLVGTLQNEGDLRHVSNGQTMRVLGPVSLTGAGTYTFATGQYSFIQGFAVGDALTLGAGQVMTTTPGAFGRLQGFALANAGIVEARGASAVLDVFLPAGVQNAGTLRAADGGTLNLGSGLTQVYANANGIIRNDSGSVLLNATFQGGRFESAAGREVRSTGAVLDGVANAIEITAGSTLRAVGLTLRGTFNNAGSIYSSNAGQSTIRIEGPVTLGGPGNLTFGPSQYTFLQGGAAADVLTLANGHTITTQPGGLVRAQGLSIVSNGVIEARGASSLFDLWPERGLTNNGVIRAAAGGTMNVGAGLQYVVENAGGSIRNEGGAVILNAVLRGGRFESGPGLEVRSTGAILDGVANPIEIPAGSTLRAAGMTLRGSIANAGNILSANAGQSTIRIEGPVNLSGPGAMTFGATQYTFLQGGAVGDALTIAASQTVTTQAGGQVRIQSLPLTSSGRIEARGAGTRFDYYSTTSTNQGVIAAVDSGLIYLGDGASGYTVDNANGILRNESGTFVLKSRVRGGRLESPSPGGFLIDPGNGHLDGSSGPVEITPGTLVYTAGGVIIIQGTIVNHGTLGLLRQSGGAVLSIPQSITLGGTGEILFGTPFNNNLQQSVGGLTFTNGATHTVRCTTGSTGAVSLDHYVNAGQTVVDGTLTFNTTSHTNAPTGVIWGRGTIITSPVLANQGKIAPGASAGALFISGSVTNAASAVFEAELGGTVSGTEFDRLSVSGSFARGGELRPVLLNGFRPAPGDSFLVLSAGSLSGAWANVVSGKVTFLQGSFDVVQTATTVTLTNFQRNAAYAAYDAWVAGYPGLTGAAKEPGADPDGDGLTNLQEFAFGLDPTRAGGALGLPRAFIDPVSGRLRIEFPRRKQTPPNFLNYELQYSSDLTGAWSIHPSGPVTTVDLDAVFELVTFEDVNGPPNYLQRFGRVRVELGP